MPKVKQSRSVLPIRALDSRCLLALPLVTYVLSYVYLAIYHGRANIWNVVVHEGGLYTLWETTFYASHFLGHVPIHTIIGLLFVGAYCSLVPQANVTDGKGHRLALGVAILLLLGVSFALSMWHFGADDTISYILQRKQTVRLYVQGGSWNLHLASTTLMFLWLPVYIFIVSCACGESVHRSRSGWGFVVASMLLLVGFTWWANGRPPVSALATAWTEPRYLAHSVREVATFSLTYFPFALYLLFRRRSGSSPQMSRPRDARLAVCLSAVGLAFAAALTYQCMASLSAGIGDMAQKPAFARDGSLSIAYLLASHFFEHVLDSIYFVLFVLWLYTFRVGLRSSRPPL